MLNSFTCMRVIEVFFLIFKYLLNGVIIWTGSQAGLDMLRYKYTLTKSGERRCIKSEFYLQDTPTYKGYTEKIFHSLHISQKPLTVRQISDLTGNRTRSVNGVITFNIYAGYIRRIFL